jgi:hypothetical protein
MLGMTARPEGIPLRPDFQALRDARMRSLARAAIAVAAHELERDSPPAAILRRRGWTDDRTADLLTRGASTPATTTQAGWAQELAQTTWAYLETLGAASAGAALLAQSLSLEFGSAAEIRLPHFVAGSSSAAFVAESMAAPTMQLVLSTPPPIVPHKLLTIALLTREMLESSNAETLVSDTLSRAAGLKLDEVLFDTAVADSARAAGLRQGVSALTASSATTKQDAFLDDVVALTNAVAAIAGNGPITFVAAPGRALNMRVRFGAADLSDKVSVLASSALTAEVLCVVPAAVVFAGGGEVRIVAERQAEIVRANPAGAPTDGAGPVMSLFQADCVALKLRLPISWTRRDSRACAWLTPTGW